MSSPREKSGGLSGPMACSSGSHFWSKGTFSITLSKHSLEEHPCVICGGRFALQGDELYRVGRMFVEGGFVGGVMGRNVQMGWCCPLAGAPQCEVEVIQSSLF